MTNANADKLILAVPKGRILEELTPLLTACDIIPEDDFTNKASRKLQFTTNNPNLDIIRVRAFDVATLTKRHFARQGIQADCIKLNGAMEIAPALGMARRIVDLVSTGSTMKANNSKTCLNL